MSPYNKFVADTNNSSFECLYTFGYKLKNLQRRLLNPVCIWKAYKLFKVLLRFFFLLMEVEVW